MSTNDDATPSRKQSQAVLTLGALAGLIASATYCFCFATYESRRRLLILDELFAWNLIADPSWRHALHAWNHGADGGGFLFYATLWPLVHGSRGSVLLPRLVSTTAYFLAAVVWWRALTRFVESQWAAMGVLLVWSSSELMLGYVYMIRFYALYLLLSALAVYTLIRAAERSWSQATSACFLFAVNGCLVCTHIIGIVYSGLVVGAWLLCVNRNRYLRWSALPIVGAWSLLLFSRKAIYYSSLSYGYQGVPHLRDVLRYYLKTMAALPIVLLAAVGLLVALRDLTRRLRTMPASDPAVVAPALCLIYLISPITLYVICLVSKPILTGRYLLPYSLALCTLCAYAIQGIAAALRTRPLWLQQCTVVFLGVLVLDLHVRAVSRLAPRPFLDSATLSRMGQNGPVLIEDEEVFLQLQHYYPTTGQFFFLLAPRGLNPGLMGVVAGQGYLQGHMLRADDFHPHGTFEVLVNEHNRAVAWNPQPDHCSMTELGTVRVTGGRQPLYSVTRCL